MVTATFRFFEELNAFLPSERRGREFSVACAQGASTKHMIEALGVPHTEVELILVNGESAGFERAVCDGDRLSIYPKFEAFDITPLLRVRDQPLRNTRFIADAHLGALARLLRMAGFDTLYSNGYDDGEITEMADREGRIVLTRDRELLKRRNVTHGCYVHALPPEQQWREIIERLDLTRSIRPFRLCLECNAPLRGVAKAEVLERLPASVRIQQECFTTCDVCHRVFWKGSHWRRMQQRLAALQNGSGDGQTAEA